MRRVAMAAVRLQRAVAAAVAGRVSPAVRPPARPRGAWDADDPGPGWRGSSAWRGRPALGYGGRPPGGAQGG